jgi:putative flippase GtrA
MNSTVINKLRETVARLFFTRRFFNYILIAGIATLINYIMVRLLREGLHLYVWLSSGLAYGSGMLFNFLINKYLNFASADRSTLGQARTFFVVAMIGLGFYSLLMEFFVQVTHMELTEAFVLSIGITMFWSFWGHNAMTFKGGFRAFISQRLKRSDGI